MDVLLGIVAGMTVGFFGGISLAGYIMIRYVADMPANGEEEQIKHVEDLLSSFKARLHHISG
jgi:uncharacterized protein YneF (UPF0154 family)